MSCSFIHSPGPFLISVASERHCVAAAGTDVANKRSVVSPFGLLQQAYIRLVLSGVLLNGIFVQAGCSRAGKPLDIVSAFQAYGEYVTGTIDEDERADVINNACPGAGACGGMYVCVEGWPFT
jgi:hypothetical protein